MPSSRLCQDFTFSGTKLLVGPHFQEDNFFSMHFFTGPYFLAGPYFFAGLNVLQDHTFFQQDQMFCRTTLLAGPTFQNTYFTGPYSFAGPHFYRAKLYSQTTPFSKTKCFAGLQNHTFGRTNFSTHFFAGPYSFAGPYIFSTLAGPVKKCVLKIGPAKGQVL